MQPIDISKLAKIPQHVAIIMDGNGRWAKNQNRPRVFGHKKGAERVRDVVETAGEAGVKALTLYAFSEENWTRPIDEVNALFQLLTTYLEREVRKLHEKNVRLNAIGCTDSIPRVCREMLEQGIALTKNNTGLVLTLALSYGGRSEIANAAKRLAIEVAAGRIDPETIDGKLFGSFLETSNLPDPDFLIRTSGEQRLSNFLLWQMAYTEFYFTPVPWPDFTKQNFIEALASFSNRDRRFGGLSKDIVAYKAKEGARPSEVALAAETSDDSDLSC